MNNNIFAFTDNNPDQPTYPGYVSVNSNDDGSVTVTVRETPTVRDGVYICSHTSGPGRCVKGGPNCNNYCNMAPEKGPMQDHPLSCVQVTEGRTASFTVPKGAWPGA